MRISIFGPPCSGKSTTSAALFAVLKRKGFVVEIITEYVKSWVYLERTPKSYDGCYLFAKQLHAEDIVLRTGSSHIITDCPIWLAAFYAQYYSHTYWTDLVSLAQKFEAENPSINILLQRDVSYSNIGRFHDSEESQKIALALDGFLTHQNISFVVFKSTDFDGISDFVISKISFD